MYVHQLLDEERCTTWLRPEGFIRRLTKSSVVQPITLWPPYHGLRIKDCTMSRNSPLLRIEHNVQREQ
jgi:hypothetical protein